MQKAWVGEMSDTRVAELQALAIEEGLRLPMAADLISFFERHGYVVDLTTGEVHHNVAVALSPNAMALCHLYGMNDADLDAIFVPDVVDEDDSPLRLDLFDFEGEAQDFEDYMQDVDFIRHGGA